VEASAAGAVTSRPVIRFRSIGRKPQKEMEQSRHFGQDPRNNMCLVVENRMRPSVGLEVSIARLGRRTNHSLNLKRIAVASTSIGRSLPGPPFWKETNARK
jgi:hypothetical protein